MRPSVFLKKPTVILAIFVIAAFGLPIFLGLSWMPLPFLPYQTGMPVSPAHMGGYDNFSFPHVDWPWRLVEKQILLSGDWPLWNPYASLGLPFPGQYQNQLFFPLEWLEIFLGPIGWNVLFVCKVLFAGFGTLLFLRRLFPGNYSTQLLGGVVYCFSAYFLWFSSIAAFINGAMLTPWLFWGALRLFDRSLLVVNRVGALGLISGLLLLSGQPQISALSLLAVVIFLIVYALSARPLVRNVGPLFLAAIAFVLGILIASVQLALFRQMSVHGYSLHSAGAYADAGTAPLNFVLMIWPFVFGQLMAPWDGSLFPSRMNAEGWPFMLGTSGLILLMTGFWAIVDRIVRRDSIPPAIVGVFAVSLLSLGIVVTGTLGFPVWKIQGLDRINFPRYVTPVLSFSVAAVACWGVSAFAGMRLLARIGLTISVCAAFAALFLSARFVISSAPASVGNIQYLELSLWETLIPTCLVMGTIAIGVNLASRNANLKGRLPQLAALCLLAEYSFFIRYGLPLGDDLSRLASVGLICAAGLLLLVRQRRAAWMTVGAGLVLPIPLLLFSPHHMSPMFDPYQIPSPATDFLRNALGPYSIGGRILSTNQTLIPNVGNAIGLAQLSSLNPKQVDTTASYIFKLLSTHPLNYTTPNAWPGVQDGPDYPSWDDYFKRRVFYNLLSVRYLVDTRSGWISKHPHPDVVLAYSDERIEIYEDKRAFPRAYSISAIKRVNYAEDAYSVMQKPEFDPTRMAVVEAPASAVSTGLLDGEMGSFKSAKIEEFKANRVTISATVGAPAIVVLSDAFFPGWRATLDGEPVQVFRVAGALRGVFVPAGSHKIIMTYWPKTLLFWIAVSFLSTLIALGMVLISAVRLRQERGPHRSS